MCWLWHALGGPTMLTNQGTLLLAPGAKWLFTKPWSREERTAEERLRKETRICLDCCIVYWEVQYNRFVWYLVDCSIGIIISPHQSCEFGAWSTCHLWLVVPVFRVSSQTSHLLQPSLHTQPRRACQCCARITPLKLYHLSRLHEPEISRNTFTRTDP